MREVFDGWDVTVTDVASGARPGLGHPAATAFVRAIGGTPRAKLGWTDVARFGALGVPAVNYGPGNPEVAHTAGEHVALSEIARGRGPDAGLANRLAEPGAPGGPAEPALARPPGSRAGMFRSPWPAFWPYSGGCAVSFMWPCACGRSGPPRRPSPLAGAELCMFTGQRVRRGHRRPFTEMMTSPLASPLVAEGVLHSTPSTSAPAFTGAIFRRNAHVLVGGQAALRAARTVGESAVLLRLQCALPRRVTGGRGVLAGHQDAEEPAQARS